MSPADRDASNCTEFSAMLYFTPVIVTWFVPAVMIPVTFPGVKYNIAENSVQLEASRSAGDNLTNGQSATFDVLEAATTLKFGTVPFSGIVNTIVVFMITR